MARKVSDTPTVTVPPLASVVPVEQLPAVLAAGVVPSVV